MGAGISKVVFVVVEDIGPRIPGGCTGESVSQILS
jgi:hypothetical protein